MLALVGSFLIKLLGSGIVAPVLEYFKQRSSDAAAVNGQNVTGDVTITQAQLTAYVEERKVIAAERAANAASPWTCWMLPVAFAVCLLHFGAIELDSTFRFNWQVAKLPAPYDQMEWSIVAAAVGFSGIQRLLGHRVFGK